MRVYETNVYVTGILFARHAMHQQMSREPSKLARIHVASQAEYYKGKARKILEVLTLRRELLLLEEYTAIHDPPES